MKKLTMFAVLALGALGVSFLSGAFETFFNFDRENSKFLGPALTAGLALGGAYLAHAGGLIDGDTRNMVMGAGIAMAAVQLGGGKVYDWGADLAAKISKKTAKKSVSRHDWDGIPDTDGDAASDSREYMPAGPTGTAPASAAPQPVPVYNINVEAAKIPKPDVATSIIGAIGDIGSSFFSSGAFGSLVGGSKGGQRLSLARV